MKSSHTPLQWKRFLVRILLPTGLAISLFVGLIFGVVLPEFEQNLLERKRETIRELTRSATSILAEHHQEELEGRFTRAEAQSAAAKRVRDLRYGPEGKDYFWITDQTPVMVMHPFRTDLNGKDVTSFTDPLGNRVFVEFARVVRERGSGYVDYVWQWKDDPSRLVLKESYVQGFKPWGWIIGTGLYTDDVRREISALSARILWISIVIVAIVSMIFAFVVLQSLRIERQRTAAEDALTESHERYRALVEAATEGTLLAVEGRCAFSNRTLQWMLDLTPEDMEHRDWLDLVAPGAEGETGRAYLRAVAAGQPAPMQVETWLRRGDGSTDLEALMSATRVTFGGREGVIVNVRDMARQRLAAGGDGVGGYEALRATLDVGVVRTTVGQHPRLVELNPAARRILGLVDGDDPGKLDLQAMCVDPVDAGAFARSLATDGVVKNRLLVLGRRDGSRVTVAVSAVLALGDDGRPPSCQGLVEDVTRERQVESEREALLSELQASLLFLNEPILRFVRPAATCEMGTPVLRAAAQMTVGEPGALLVTADGREPVGIVTDRDLRERVVVAGLDPAAPVFRIMSSPLVTIDNRALVYEALQRMRERGIQHLAVRDEGGQIQGLVRQADLSQLHRYSAAVLIEEIRRAESPEVLSRSRARLPEQVRTLIASGARPRNVNRVVTAVSDAVTERLVALAIEEMGLPPRRFCWVAMGSEGREEQTLATDQDNAIVYEDSGGDADPSAEAWFRALGVKVCQGLNDAGYQYCPGEIMARNPNWCRPLSSWKASFSSWIRTRNPQDLLAVQIFFDFRCVVGERTLTEELRRHIREELSENPAFFPLFAQNAQTYRPPLGLFGHIVAESEGRGPKTLSLKDAMMPIVNFARLYALRHDVAETNTFDRLRRLHEKNALTRSSLDEVTEAYAFLMEARLKRQAAAVGAGAIPGNQLDPKALTPLEEALLRKTFGQVGILLKKVGFDFLGAG